jgi:hypothetical protein
MKGRFRKLEDQELDALHAAAATAVESLRDDRNSNLTLAPITQGEDGEEAVTVPLQGVNAVDDLGAWTRRLRSAIRGCKLSQETNSNGTARYNLVLPKYVEDTSPLPGTDSPAYAGPRKPSSDRAMLLLVLLAILSAMLWGRL